MRFWALGGILLLSATALSATPAAGGAADKKSSSDYDAVELQGCLQTNQGNYILVDKDNTYERLSSTSKLRNLIGHEIKVTGKRVTKTVDATLPGAASSAIEVHQIDVKTVTDISPNCQQ